MERDGGNVNDTEIDPHLLDFGIDGPIGDSEAVSFSPSVKTSDTPPDYPGARRNAPAHSTNYHRWTAAAPRTVSLIVIHITDGHASVDGTLEMFQQSGHKASAHYIVGQDGEVVQVVPDRDIAFHAHALNKTSIGIEHAARSPKEWGRNDPGLPVSEAQLAAVGGAGALVVPAARAAGRSRPRPRPLRGGHQDHS